jgi:SAM-dependent methyltransferase
MPPLQATAMALPFQADAFDASLAILTVHHWPDKARGLRELRRVSRDRVVILSWDPTYAGCFWLTEYIPQIADEVRRIFPMLHEYEPELGPVEVIDVRIPHDCIDGFMGAYWRRPEAYLNQRVRAAISTFAKIGDVTLGLTRLDRDLKSGEWNRRDGDILTGAEMSLGYRLIIAK